MEIRLETAMAVCRKIEQSVDLGAEQIAIAGQIRRKCPMVDRLDFVVIPVEEIQDDLFGNVVSRIDLFLPAVIDSKQFCNILATKSKISAVFKGGAIELPVFFWLVTGGCSWGITMFMATGPDEYTVPILNRYTSDMHDVKRYWRDHQLIEVEGSEIRTVVVPTEREFFDLCGLEWVLPEDRKFAADPKAFDAFRHSPPEVWQLER